MIEYYTRQSLVKSRIISIIGTHLIHCRGLKASTIRRITRILNSELKATDLISENICRVKSSL